MALRALNPSQFEEVADAPPAAGGGRLRAINPDQFEEVSADKGPSLLESAARGAKQGATFGWGDEIAGALSEAFSGGGNIEGSNRYENVRDEARAKDAAAQKAHPIGFGLGQIVGGVAASAVPGVGQAMGLESLGTGFAANAARGALAGGLSAAGESEAKDVKGLVQDTAKGGLVGGALGGILGTLSEKYVKGAPEREDKTILSDIGNRANKQVRDKMAATPAKAAEVVDVARQQGLDQVARDPVALLEKSTAAQKDVGQKIGQAWETIDQEHLGASSREVLRAVKSVQRDLKGSPTDEPLYQQALKFEKLVKDKWGSGARDRVPLAQLNAEVTKLETQGVAAPALSIQGAKKVKRDLAGALEEVLQGRLDEIRQTAKNVGETSLAQRPAFAGTQASGAAVDALPDLNKQYRNLKLITTAAKQRAPLESYLPNGIRQIADSKMAAAGGIASLATGNPLPFLATAVGAPAARAANRAATTALAKLARAARAGNVTAGLVQEALAAGVPRGTVAAMAPGIAHATMGAAN